MKLRQERSTTCLRKRGEYSRDKISLGFLIDCQDPIGAHLDNRVVSGEEEGRCGGFHMPFPDGNLMGKKDVRGAWPRFAKLLGQAS